MTNAHMANTLYSKCIVATCIVTYIAISSSVHKMATNLL